MIIVNLRCNTCNRKETLVVFDDLPSFFCVGCVVCGKSLRISKPPPNTLHTNALFDKVVGKMLLYVDVENTV